MKTIHKYSLVSVGDTRIYTHKDAQIISAHVQKGIPCVWALVDDEKPKATRIIQVHLTGGNADRRTVGIPIGTILMDEGSFVIHVFDGGEE